MTSNRARPRARAIEADPAATADRAGLGGAGRPTSEGRPMGRGGRLSIVGGGYVILAGGLVLLGAVVAAPDSGINNGLTAIAGALTIVLAAILIAEIVDRRIAGMIGLLGGLALGISALVPETIEGPEIGRLLGGALLLMGSAGVLSARLGETAEDGRLE